VRRSLAVVTSGSKHSMKKRRDEEVVGQEGLRD
jgi:hypothetical protein